MTKTHPTIVLVRTRLLLQKKKQKSSFKSVLKTCGEEKDNDNDDIVEVMDTDGEEEEGDDIKDDK
jgi:hypothetical protein